MRAGGWSPLVAAVIALGAGASPAAANVTAPVVIAGPDPGIVELGGVAMADDGTGGAIFRRTDATGSHIFVSRYTNSQWSAPERVDTALPYSSFEPRIAAAEGGRLLAIWTQDYAHRGSIPLYRLQSASLAIGARHFETPIGIDRNVGGPLGVPTDLDPDIAMNNAGVAYLTYRVVTTAPANLLHPTDIGSEYRVARLNPGTWSVLGAVNRNRAAAVPKPADGNGPQVSVDEQGNGIVAFIEPDDTGIERVWARRLFGTRLGLVLKASPTMIGTAALQGDADAFSLAGGGFGVGTVAVRQQPGPGSLLPGPRIFVNQLPPSFDDAARDFVGPKQIGDSGGQLSVPHVAVDAAEDTTIAYASAAQIRTSVSTERSGPQPSITVDSGTATGPPLIANGPRGANFTAWPVQRGDVIGVALHQALPGGGDASALLSGPLGGGVQDIAVAASGLGDGLVAFRQGAGQSAQIVASAVQLPPQPFLAFGPEDWIRPSQARVSWERPPSAVGHLKFDVVVDGQTRIRGVYNLAARIPVQGLGDGTHEVQVRATDLAGQVTITAPFDLMIDGSAPTARAEMGKGRKLTVRVTDGKKAVASGTVTDKIVIGFGDGKSARGDDFATHRYARRGTYRVTVKSADAAGNSKSRVFRVKVR